jgi:putative transposase
MQRSKFTAEQMAQIIQEADAHRGAANEVARKYGITTKTISNWRKQFKGMQSEDIKNLKRLEEENSRLKRLVSRQAYDIECLKEINSKKW